MPERTEGIRVQSIIGRFFEQSRFFHFAAGNSASADGSGRVEVIAPVLAYLYK